MMREAGQQSCTTHDAAAAAWGERLAGLYRNVAERSMRDLPIFNDALAVDAVGFREFGGKVIGIIVTPWFMNIVTPADGLASPEPGASLRLHFPTGDIDFTVSDIAGAGRIASCSLFSPMFQFTDMAAARATAEAAIEALMTAPGKPDQAGGSGVASIDRRNFLRGALAERRV